MNRKTRLGTIILMAFVTAASLLLFLFFYRWDNKYTRPRPPANMGVIRLDSAWYEQHPLFYLADNWAFYQGKCLGPDEVQEHAVDAYFYIGRYGGFDLGDPQKKPHGRGTYRTVILTDGPEQEYALELTPIYSAWRLWVNGKLMQRVGMGEPDLNRSMSAVTFTAGERIEIVVEVEDENHFYSGMVYPPAFGTPEAVNRTSALRLLIHGTCCTVALFIGALCMIVGVGSGFTRPYGILALLCLCFCGSTAWPVFQVIARGLDGFLLMEQVCYYGICTSMMWIQGRICKLPRKICAPARILGGLICLSAVVRRFIPVTAAWQLYAYGNVLGAFKWFTAFWLLGASCWALYRKAPYSIPMMAGNSIFAAALVMDKLLPLYEPVLTGWFVEIAGAAVILLVAEVGFYDMHSAFAEKIRLSMEKRLSHAQLEARAQYAKLQQEYVIRTRKQLHETRSCYTLLRHYAGQGDLKRLREYLDEVFPTLGISTFTEHTGHSLIDAILCVQTAQAAQDGVYMEIDGDSLSDGLSMEDGDITALLMNLLNNASEACLRLSDGEERWIYLELKREDQALLIRCTNSSGPPALQGERTSKEDKLAHGYGMEVMEEAAAKYGGSLETEREEDSFQVEIRLKNVIKEVGKTP